MVLGFGLLGAVDKVAGSIPGPYLYSIKLFGFFDL
jgi:hypothetical protein